MTENNLSGAPKAIGFWRSWALVVGTAVGSGIWLSPTIIAPYGFMGLWVWLVAGGCAILIAFSLGNTARRDPSVGGCYAYTKKSFGDFPAFVIAWFFWLSIATALAAGAITFAGYLGNLIPFIATSPAASIITGLFAIWTVTFFNLKGVEEMSIVQMITVILKISPLIFIAGYGLITVSPSQFENYSPEIEPTVAAFSSVLILAMFAFMGIEAATVPAEDTEDAANIIPKAILFGTLTIALIYFFSNYAVMGILPKEELIVSTAPMADTFSILFGPIGASAVAFFVLVSVYGALNSNLCLAAQTMMAAARDKLLPPTLAHKSKYGVPDKAIIFTSVMASLFMLANYSNGLIAAFQFLLLMSTISTLLVYIFSALAGIYLGSKDPNTPKSTLIKESVLAIIVFIICSWIIMGAGEDAIYWTFIFILLNIPAYIFMKIALKR